MLDHVFIECAAVVQENFVEIWDGLWPVPTNLSHKVSKSELVIFSVHGNRLKHLSLEQCVEALCVAFLYCFVNRQIGRAQIVKQIKEELKLDSFCGRKRKQCLTNHCPS